MTNVSPMRIAVIGATGRIGGEIVEQFSRTGRYDVLALSHQDIDVADAESVRRALLAQPLDVVINTAAFHSVDGCENNPETSFAVNAIGAMNVAAASHESDATCVYLSTDYVFDGRSETPYDEGARPNPINVYGVSKLAAEQLTARTTPRHILFRVERVFGRPGQAGRLPRTSTPSTPKPPTASPSRPSIPTRCPRRIPSMRQDCWTISSKPARRAFSTPPTPANAPGWSSRKR